MTIITESPVWLLLLCFLAGGAYSAFLYYRAPLKDNPAWLLVLLAVFRFLSVSAIAFLLTSPLIRVEEESVQKPIIIIGVDNSSSIRMSRDSLFNETTLPARIRELSDRLGSEFQVELYSFGERTSKGFTGKYDDKETDISAFLNDLADRYYNRNVGALILATDGIYNSGSDPYYAAKQVSYPVYTVALGDTVIRRDIMIRQVRHNKRAFRGSPFPVEVFIEMDQTPGVSTELTLSQGDKILQTREIRAAGEKHLQKVSFMIEPDGTGIRKFSVNLLPVLGEASTRNNQQDFFVEVLEAKEKIAILYDAPHPDVNAVRLALEQSERYQLEEYNTRDLSKFSPEQYDLVIFNQLPSVTSGLDLAPLLKNGKSSLFILGTQTDVNAFNRLGAGLTVNASKLTFAEAKPVMNPDFPLFTLPRDAGEVIAGWPPLLAPFGLYQYSPMSEKLVVQKIGSAVTNAPLILFISGAGRKTGIIAGENLWRWRFVNYFNQSNFNLFDEVITKTAQYLMVREDRSFFRVNVNPTIRENESVRMEAEVFNASYEKITEPEVTIVIENEKRESFPFTFGKTDAGYFLNAGLFPPGTYTWVAAARSATLSYSKKGTLIVTPVNAESLRLTADHRLLYRIAASHDGKMISPEKTDSLAEWIKKREDIHSVSYVSRRLSDLLGNGWFFGLILLLMTTEWLIRKRNGI